MRPAAAGWWGSCDPLHYCEVVLCLHVTCFILDRTGEFCYLTKLLIGYDQCGQVPQFHASLLFRIVS